MSHSHIILLDQDGLNLLNRIHKNDGDGAALELGQKILSLCNKCDWLDLVDTPVSYSSSSRSPQP
jgi:hypothetical protein